MKKILIALSLVAVLCCASCSKTCKCTAKGSAGDKSASAEKTITLKEGEKCSDYNSKAGIGSVSVEFKCVPQLF